jgi:hypothetical protein
MVTRLVRMAGALRTGTAFEPTDPLTPAAQGDEARQEALATAVGNAAGAAYDGWRAALADDAGPVAIITQPAPEVRRFGAATMTWRGGSNAADQPVVRVDRLDDDGTWLPYADQSGEIQTMLDMPDGIEGVVGAWTGQQEWRWTATFEAFDGFPATFGQVPDGTYRFVVDGAARSGGTDVPYHLESAPFAVTPWDGITVADLAVVDGDVHVVVDPIAYPRSYTSSLRYVADDGNAVLCKTCSFRPWATTGEVDHVDVLVRRVDGTVKRTVHARLVDGVWIANPNLRAGEVAEIPVGGIVDTFGEINGTAVSTRKALA